MRDMIILITGASHTGKTWLAQRLLEKYKYPYLSIDLLKMGLIRSGNTNLTPEDDAELEPYLWSIVRKMIQTAMENHQNLIVEGGYIPFDWKKDFADEFWREMHAYCLVMSKHYIRHHFSDIKQYANIIEQRGDDSWCTMDFVMAENARYLKQYHTCDWHHILIDDCYCVEVEL